MDFVFILFSILSFFIVTFAFLHLLAGGVALLKGDKTKGNILIFVGGLIALPAIPLLAIVPRISFVTWIVGATLCFSTIKATYFLPIRFLLEGFSLQCLPPCLFLFRTLD